MEGRKTKPRVILVFGAPCCGKTTFAQKFADKYDLAFYDLSEIQESYGFNRETILRILDLIGRTHKDIVIEGCLDTETFYDEAVERTEAPSDTENPIILSGKHTFETQCIHTLAGLADVNRR